MNRSVLAYQVLSDHGVFVDTWTSIPDHVADSAVFFLTHFHTDHMQGLNENFQYSIIYCSHSTRCLLLAKFPALKDVVMGCNFCETMVHRGSFDLCFTLFDAHHCSGSSMFLFESTRIGRVLCTGDFRFDDQIMLDTMLPFLSTSRLDYCLMDATFCSYSCTEFPKRSVSTNAVIELIRQSPSSEKVILNLQPLGAEPIIEAICKAFVCRVHLDFPCSDVQILVALPFFRKYCTCDDSLRFRICSTKQFNEEVLRKNHQEKLDLRTLFIRVTTMWFAREKLCHRSVIESEPNVYRVLHSMHSSLSEVREFVRQIVPQQIGMSAIPFDFDVSRNRHQNQFEKLVGGRYRRRAGGQDEFFKKITVPARVISPAKAPFTPVLDQQAPLISDGNHQSSLDFFKGSSIFLHSQLDIANRHKAVLLVAQLGAKRVAALSEANVVLLDISKQNAWRALRRIVHSTSKTGQALHVFDSAVLGHINADNSLAAIEKRFSLWNNVKANHFNG